MAGFGLIVLLLSLLAFTISLGGIIYQHMVELPNWKLDMPDSLKAYRAFFRRADFGDFFKLFMPLSFVFLIIAIVLLWNRPEKANTWTVLSLLGFLSTAMFTNSFFVRIHDELFKKELGASGFRTLEELEKRWRRGNLVRIAIMLFTIAAMLRASVWASIHLF
jgi:hypothetical protein